MPEVKRYDEITGEPYWIHVKKVCPAGCSNDLDDIEGFNRHTLCHRIYAKGIYDPTYVRYDLMDGKPKERQEP